jgi:hypothetical protein
VRGSWPGSGKARAACAKKSAKAKIAGETIELYKSLELGCAFLMRIQTSFYTPAFKRVAALAAVDGTE